MIGIFDRSHYEDVLVVRVHRLATPEVVEKRYGEIARFEAGLADQGYALVKCFLHISYDEQRERLLARLDDPDKHWKFNEGDLAERAALGRLPGGVPDRAGALLDAPRALVRRARRPQVVPQLGDRPAAAGDRARARPPVPPPGPRRQGAHKGPRPAELMRVHLDTDFAGDTDDACALAYLLARDDVDLVGVTTVADADGRRAAYVRYFLELAGRAGRTGGGRGGAVADHGEQAEPEHGDWPDLLPCPSRRARRSTCSTGRSPPARP